MKYTTLFTCAALMAAGAAGRAEMPAYAETALSAAHRAELAADVPNRLASAETELTDLRRRCADAFKGAEDTLQAERVAKRLEIADRLCRFVHGEFAKGDVSGFLFAERGIDDLRRFRMYFADELRHWVAYPKGGADETHLDVRAFGAKGDGKTGCTVAFMRAFDEARARGGRPCRIVIPEGDWLMDERVEVPAFRDGRTDQWVMDSNLRHAQFPVFALTNCVVEGAGPKKTRIRCGVYASQGLRLIACVNTTVRGLEIDWVETPFCQGTIEETNGREAWAVICREAGSLRPDDPRYKSHKAEFCASAFTPEGELDRPASLMFCTLQCEALGGERYRVHFDASRSYSQHAALKVGRKLVIPDRNNFHHAASMAFTAFCNLEDVWVRTSPAAAFSVHAGHQNSFSRCRLFPKPELLMSANADGLICAHGTYMAHCSFRSQSDDGFNAMCRGGFIDSQPDARSLVHEGVGRFAAGDLLLAVDPVTGQYRGNLRVTRAARNATWRGQGANLTEFAEVPSGLRTYDSLGMAELSQEELGKAAMNLTKVKDQPDHLYAPCLDGIGTVVTDCEIANMRGTALVLQGPDVLVESNRISHVWSAIRLGGLVKYKEGPPPYNAIVRGNRISDVDFGITTQFQVQDRGSAKTDCMRGLVLEDNVVERCPSTYRLDNTDHAAKGAAENPYGMCSHITRTGFWDREKLYGSAEKAGAKWVRMDFDWNWLERGGPGKWDFERYDECVTSAERHGLQVLPIVYNPPKDDARVWERLDRWEEFLRTVAKRYGKRLPVYEIWNEQDCEPFWGFQPSAADYLALLKRSCETLKSINPGTRVAFGGVTPHGLKFIDEVCALGGEKYFDVVCVHPYAVRHQGEDSRPEGDLDVWLADLKAILTKYGCAGKPVWITEIGWPAPCVVKSAAPGLVQAGLDAIRPGKKIWRTLVTDPLLRADDAAGRDVLAALVRAELPEGSEVSVCRFVDFAARIAAEKPEVVFVSPCSQDYPADQGRALVAFAEAGGVIVEAGGMPFYRGPDGSPKPDLAPFQLRRALHFDSFNWWNQEEPRMPKALTVFPTDAAKNVKAPKGGFTGNRFVTDRFLRPGDAFTPLLTGVWTNGATCVAAAAYRYANGGGLVVNALMSYSSAMVTEDAQARFVPRAHLLAFAGGAEKVIWYELRSHDYDRHDQGWGMLHSDCTPKPSWKAYETFLSMRPAGSTPRPRLPRDGNGGYAFEWTRPDGTAAGALWTTGSPRRVTFEFSSPDVVFRNLYGHPVPESAFVREGKRVTLELTGDVVYFTGVHIVMPEKGL